MPDLKIAKDLSLPLDAVTQKLAWLGRTGSGKTYGCKRMVEEMIRAGAQVVILDPVGVWAGLRLGPKSLDVAVLGGLFGDLPLEHTAGVVVADLVVDQGVSMVLDLSQALDAPRTRFAEAFARQFFARKKAAPSAVHLVIEECQEFIPQNHQHGEEKMLHEFQRIAKLGRNFGIGLSLISQRPQEVNKKALNQAECVFAFQMTGPQERKALEFWLNDKGFNAKLSEVLPRLDVGAPYVWSPQWLKISEVVQILPIDSLDTSQTPKVGEKAFTQAKLKSIDLKAISAAMADTVERAKADDPRALRAEINTLRAQLIAKGQPNARVVGEIKAFIHTETFLFDEAAFGAVFERVSTVVDGVAKSAVEAKAEIGRVLVQYRNEQRAAAKAKSKSTQLPAAAPAARPVVASSRAPIGSGTGDPSIGQSGLRRIMIALAQRPQGLTNRQIGVRAGVSSKSGTFSTYMSKARTSGWVDGKPLARLTPAGIAALGEFSPLPSGPALLEYWLSELGESGASRLLRAFAAAYPRSLSNSEAGEAAEISAKSGTFSTYMSKLRTLELLKPSEGGSRASAELFE